jgi:hypothetical protein
MLQTRGKAMFIKSTFTGTTSQGFFFFYRDSPLVPLSILSLLKLKDKQIQAIFKKSSNAISSKLNLLEIS